MTKYRLSSLANADLANILHLSETRHGKDARVRYRGLLTAALRRVAADPQGPSTVDRSELVAGLRNLHTRHARKEIQ